MNGFEAFFVISNIPSTRTIASSTMVGLFVNLFRFTWVFISLFPHSDVIKMISISIVFVVGRVGFTSSLGTIDDEYINRVIIPVENAIVRVSLNHALFVIGYRAVATTIDIARRRILMSRGDFCWVIHNARRGINAFISHWWVWFTGPRFVESVSMVSYFFFLLWVVLCGFL